MILKIIKNFLNKKIKWIRKKFNRFKRSLNFKKPRKNINIINYEDLNSDKELNVEDADDDEYRKIGSVRRLFEEPNRDYYKPRVINRGFAGEVNNYIKYIREGDKDEKLSLREYLNTIRPYLRDLINRHQPIERLNNNNNNNNNDNDNDNIDNNDTDRGEWKIMLRVCMKCISTKSFIETRTMHPKNKQVEIYMGSDAEDVIDALLNSLLQNFQRIQEISNERGSEFIPDGIELLEYELHKTNIIRAESYIPSPD